MILDLTEVEFLRGMYFKLKTSFWRKNSYIPELILNFVSLKAKYKSHMNMWEGINNTKLKIKILNFILIRIIQLRVLTRPGSTTQLKSYKF